MSINTVDASDYYFQRYKQASAVGRDVMAKFSGEFTTPEQLQQVAADLEYLRVNDIGVMKFFGSGKGVDDEFAKNTDGEQRRKTSDRWGRHTNEKEFNQGVWPYYQNLRERARQLFPHDHILEPDNILCLPHSMSSDDYLGRPVLVKNIDLNPNTIVLPVGRIIPGAGTLKKKYVNVNMDLVCEAVLKQQVEPWRRRLAALFHGRREFIKFMQVTGSGGIIHEDEVVPLLSVHGLNPDGTHPEISITDGMQVKAAANRETILSGAIPSIVMVTLEQFKPELFDPEGAGTEMFDHEKLTCSSIQDALEKNMVLQQLKRQQEQKLFQSDMPVEQVVDQHRLLRLNGFPKAGYTAVNCGRDPEGKLWRWILNLWPQKLNTKFGRCLAQHWLEDFMNSDADILCTLATHTSELAAGTASAMTRRAFFEMDLPAYGRIKQVQAEGLPLPDCLKNFDTTEVNPHLCMRKKPGV